MRILFVAAFCSVVLTACSTPPRDAELHQLSLSMNTATNERDMRIAGWEITHVLERRLNAMIAEIHYLYGEDQRFIRAFDTAQKKWEDYRDAMLEARFPAEEKEMEYGQNYWLALPIQSAELLKARIAEVSPWTEGTEEGDITSGSVGIKEHLDERRRSRKKHQPEAGEHVQTKE